MSKGYNEQREIQYRKDIFAALPAELQIINRLIEQGQLVQAIHSHIDMGDLTDILVFDVNRSKPEQNEFYVYGIDVKQINGKGGQFPRGFRENTIIFETKNRSGNPGWGLFPNPQNRYIAIVDGFGWDIDMTKLCGEYQTVEELDANKIRIKEKIVKQFTRTPGQLTHRYYMFSLEELQEFYNKHKEDQKLLPYIHGRDDQSECRRIPLSIFRAEGYGYSYWEYQNDRWICTKDETNGEKSVIPGKIRHLYTGKEYSNDEIPEIMLKIQDVLKVQQDKYMMQQRAYVEKGYANKNERIDYLQMKESARTQHEWEQSRLVNE